MVLAHFRSACVLQCCAICCACSYGCSYVGSRLHSVVMPPSELRMRWHQKASFRGARLVSAPVVACGMCLFSRRSVDRARLTSSARVGHSPQALKVRRVRWQSMPYLLAIPVLTVLSQANGSRWTFQLRLWRRFLTLKRARPLRNWCVRVAGVVLYPPCACSGNNGAARRLLLASRTCQASPSSAGTGWIYW